ncbi:hypothetical protein [Ammoniphilus sp. YIM 78166]|uniref:hypothetical protein n=1 Tax=Ammoniphilus sp. YIM 78166 TaxID=1644106 RepID=UPI00106F851D|nr:hypothetical protein [Ammoniphilus sp. YIM 78166]
MELFSLGGIIISLLSMLLPLVIVAFFIRWAWVIKINSDKQVEQNKEIIDLLKNLNEKLEKEK